ncbi:Gfo/Idh/MocA family oxidoreductase [Planctomycetota bacterium]|nr:Gfo/Idh/MocA family oxidoreductase [Planctomycetota bacterium]
MTENYTIEADAGAMMKAPEIEYKPARDFDRKLKIGMIGCGGITKQHLSGYKKGGYEVVAFADLDNERACERRDEFYPKAKVYDTHKELLNDRDVEIVDIATHPDVRAALIKDAIEAKKHVLSQKPFVLDLKTGEELTELADDAGVCLAVNQNGRWAPHVSYMREAINVGLVGDVTSISMTVAWDHNWVKGTAFDEMPHLVLYDFAIHWFDMVNCYMGDREAKRVFANVCHCSGQDAKPPLGATVNIEYEDALVTMHFDANTRFGARDTTLIVGTKGSLRSDGVSLGEQELSITMEQGTAAVELEGSWFPDGFDGTISELMSAVDHGRVARHSARDNLKSLAMAFAAMASAEKGVAVDVGDATCIEPSWLKYGD